MVREIIQKLKPLYSAGQQKKLDHLYALYTTANKDRQIQIEQMIAKLAAKHRIEEVDEKIILPPPRPSEKGDISIGTVQYLDKDHFDYKLKTSELTRHAGIFGSTGTGKTTLARHIITNLLKKKIPFIVFDWEQSYRSVIKESDDVLLFTVGKAFAPFRFNFFKIPPGIDYKEYVKHVIEIFSRSYVGGAGSDTILKRAFDTAYQYAGTPLLSEVEKILDGTMKAKQMRGREMLWKQSAKRMIEFMLYGGTGQMYDTKNTFDMKDLFTKPIIFELSGLSSANDKRFFVEIITLWYWLLKESEGIHDENLRHVMIFEEFHNIVENSKKDDLIQKAFRQLRKYGTGLIALDQTPSLIPTGIFENMGTKISFSLDHQANIRAVANAMYMEKDQVRFIGLLKIGEAIVRSKQRYPYPFLVKVPFASLPSNITDEDILRRMKPYFQLAKTDSQEQLWCPPIQPLNKAVSIPSGGELVLLQDMAINPFIGTDKRYKTLGLSSREGNGFKQNLESEDYINPVNVDRKVLYELTAKAREFLLLRKFKLPSQARGGIEHNYWLNKVSQYFNKIEGFPFREKGDIDLVVEHYNSTTLIEVETGKSDIAKNVQKLMKTKADRRIMVGTTKSAEAKIRKILKSLLPPNTDIEVYHIKDFLSQSNPIVEKTDSKSAR